jgi:hypothetical protein
MRVPPSWLKISTSVLLLAPHLAGCSRRAPPVSSTWADDFDRASVGSDWNNTGGPYRIENGALTFEQAHNHPLWLRRPLPDDVRIDVDATGLSPDGDIKVVLAGDGKSFESDEAVRRDLQYTETGYVFIFGGWHNHVSALVKMQEHEWQRDPAVPRSTSARLVPGKTYHWTIVRRGGHIEWDIDGQAFLVRDDPAPLSGPDHCYFAFTGWESAVRFDNLKVQALETDSR